MKSSGFSTSFTESRPFFKSETTDFVFEKMRNRLETSTMQTSASKPQTAVTSQPVSENWPSKPLTETPVSWKKFRKTGICVRKTNAERTKTTKVSMIRSVTTVPTQQVKFVPS